MALEILPIGFRVFVRLRESPPRTGWSFQPFLFADFGPRYEREATGDQPVSIRPDEVFRGPVFAERVGTG